jgi:hypothetical protein
MLKDSEFYQNPLDNTGDFFLFGLLCFSRQLTCLYSDIKPRSTIYLPFYNFNAKDPAYAAVSLFHTFISLGLGTG